MPPIRKKKKRKLSIVASPELQEATAEIITDMVADELFEDYKVGDVGIDMSAIEEKFHRGEF